MEIVIKGSGEIKVRFIDRRGKTLIQESIRISGSETVEARREVSLLVETLAGQVLVSPVLVQQREKQHVTFDGENHTSFTKKRCQEIGCTQSVVEDAVRGCVQAIQENTIRLPSALTQNDKATS